ncbi:MAG: hypothetical protein ABIA63_07810 [bacterium]
MKDKLNFTCVFIRLVATIIEKEIVRFSPSFIRRFIYRFQEYRIKKDISKTIYRIQSKKTDIRSIYAYKQLRQILRKI